MRIWVDVITPKQALFFQPLVEEIRRQGHEVLATSRHYREVKALAKQIGFELSFVGAHGGANRYDKLVASSARTTQLAGLVQGYAPDRAISFSSPECARVAFGLAVPHICVSDSPHAENVARLTIPLSTLLVSPWIIPYSDWTRYGISKSQIERYHALDPAAWLKRRSRGLRASPADFGLDKGRKTIVVRLEERFASYLLGKDMTISEKILDLLAERFSQNNVVILGRYEEQIEAVRKRVGHRLTVPERIIDGGRLLVIADIFVGMGGTMTAEACLMGVPALSAYPGDSLRVEQYLVSQKLLVKPRTLHGFEDTLRKLLEGEDRAKLAQRASRLLAAMEDPVAMIKKLLLDTKLPFLPSRQ